MRRIALIAAAALGLSACVATPAGIPATPSAPVEAPGTGPVAPPASSVVDRAADAVIRADAAVDQAAGAYIRIRDVANLVLPYLSPDRAARIRAIQATAEAAFRRARVASDLAVQAAELAKAANAARQLETLTVDPD